MRISVAFKRFLRQQTTTAFLPVCGPFLGSNVLDMKDKIGLHHRDARRKPPIA
jgi:hypothetical protein